MTIEDWVCEALDTLDCLGAGDDPCDVVPDDRLNKLVEFGLVKWHGEPVSEMGNNERVGPSGAELTITQEGHQYMQRCDE